MVQALLSRVRNITGQVAALIILSLTGTFVQAQSVLLPGDVVIVTVNASDNSFDFIPLVDLEAGTSLSFKTGVWNEEYLFIEEGEEVNLIFHEPIEAGTNLHINSAEDSRYERNGSLTFSGEGDRIYVAQQDEGMDRVIFGIGWGNDDLIRTLIPGSISEDTHSLIVLGGDSNYQYYLRNGASGTPRMLTNVVSDPSNWRSSNEASFPPFGTTFRLLKPPVVLFDDNVSTTNEGDSITLNVAIYEHDGSKLTVDAFFSERYSTADTTDLGSFRKFTFNFTGLIGDAVYAIRIPTVDDDTYSGSRNAFFELENLSKGNYGDFVSHVAFLRDNETPDLFISAVSVNGDSASDFIEIRNSEGVSVDLSGWSLRSRAFKYEFEENRFIQPYSSLRIYPPNPDLETKNNSGWPRRTGSLTLYDGQDQQISSLNYREGIQPESIRINSGNEPIRNQQVTNNQILSGANQRVSSLKIPVKIREAGWYVNDDQNEESAGFYWDEPAGKFRETETAEVGQKALTTIMYKSEEELVTESEQLLMEGQDNRTELTAEMEFTISGTDTDENGMINGSEGYNLLYNPTNSPISVDHLLNTMESQLFEGAVYPFVYTSDDGRLDWKNINAVGPGAFIPAKTPFWLRADSVFKAVSVRFTQSTAPVVPEFKDVTEEDGYLRFRLRSEQSSSQVRINFYGEQKSLPRDVINPTLYTGIGALNGNAIELGAGYGLNWNSVYNLTITEDERMVIPLAFTMKDGGLLELSVSGWENIPAGWSLLLQDRSTGKTHDIDEDWSLEFDYFTNFTEVSDSEVLSRQNENTLEPDERFQINILPPGVEITENIVPEVITLGQNYPNPFNPRTIISFYLPESMRVKLSVFNVVGQPIAVLAEGVLGVGDHEFEWDASGLPSGMYIYQLEVGTKVMTRKMTLVK